MNAADRARIQQSLRDQRNAIVEGWLHTVSDDRYRSSGSQRTRQRLGQLAEQAITIMLGERFKSKEAQALGLSLAELADPTPEALGNIQEVLATQLAAGLPSDRAALLQPRLTRLLIGVSIGFLQQSQQTLQKAPDDIEQWMQAYVAKLASVNGQLAQEIAQRKQMEKQLQRQLQEATLLYQLSTQIARAEDLIAALQGVCTELARFLQVPQAGFALINPDGTAARVVADFRPSDSPSAMGAEIPVTGNPSMAYILKHRIPLAVNAAQEDPILAPIHEIMRQRSVASILIVPIIVDGDIIGTLGFDAFERRVFNQSDIDLVQSVANQAGQVLLRKRTEEALQASEEAIRALIDATTDVLILTDLRGIILEANEAAAHRFGMCTDEFVGSCIWDLLPPEVAARRIERASEILRSGEPVRFEDWRSGMWFDNAVHPVRDANGTITGFALFARDFTERRYIEEALKESESRLNSILTAMVDSVFAFDCEGRFTFYHAPPIEEPYVLPHELLGKPFLEVMPQHLHEPMTEALIQNREGQVAEYEYWLKINGNMRWFTAKLSPVSVDGKYQGSVAVSREITERKQMEERLRRSLEETARGQRMLLALSQATQESQRARTREEIYRIIGDSMASMGYDVTIFTFTADRAHLVPMYMTYNPDDLLAAEKLTGFSPNDDRLPVVPGGFVEQAIAARTAVFSSQPDKHMAQVLPSAVGSPFEQLTLSMGIERVIHAPLVVGDEIHGFLVVTGTDLRATDTQAISIFASQTAIALANVRLFQETRTWAAELEKRVAMRTQELASANKELEGALSERKKAEQAVRRSREETLRSHRLLLALSQATEVVQRAHTPKEVYQTIGDQVASLGYRAIVFSVTKDRTHLFLTHLTIQLATLQAAESFSAGLTPPGIQLPLTPGSPFQKVIAENRTILLDQTADQVVSGLPDLGLELQEQLASILGNSKSICAPLSGNGKPHGLLAITGKDLTEADLPTVTLFANRAATAVENARLMAQLTISRRQLQQLTRQVVSTQEEERQRLSRALHDEAGQVLTALKISLKLIGEDLPADDALLRQRIDDAVTLTDSTMERIRLLAQDLRPPALDAVGLSHTLDGLCQDFGERTKLVIAYRGQELPKLPGPVNIVLYRFVQEALTNVAKHSGARQVSVVLWHDAEALHLSVEDDGKGFSLSSRESSPGLSNGLGLLGMQERIESLGGRLEIRSRSGLGTCLIAHVPLLEV